MIRRRIPGHGTAASPYRGRTRTGTARPAARCTSICARTTSAIIRNCGEPGMTKRTLASVLAVLLCVSPILNAQEGHPLVGTWHGTWGPNATTRHDVTLVLEF